MERREILRYTALATGAAVSLPLMSTFLSSCKSESMGVSSEALHFFSLEEMKRLKEIVDIILPKTDSPCASEVGVHKTIDNMVGLTYFEDDQKSYRKGFEALLGHIGNSEGEELKKKLLDLFSTSDETLRKAFLDLRQQTIAYYLSTEEVGKNFLNYLPVPGEYEGCISLESVGGKAWAL